MKNDEFKTVVNFYEVKSTRYKRINAFLIQELNYPVFKKITFKVIGKSY